MRLWAELAEDLRHSGLRDVDKLAVVQGLGGELCEALSRWLERSTDGGEVERDTGAVPR